MAIKYLDLFRINSELSFSSTHDLEQFRIEFLKNLKSALLSLRADEVRKKKSTIYFKIYPMRLFVSRYNLLNEIREGEINVSVKKDKLHISFSLISGESVLLLIVGLILMILIYSPEKFLILVLGGILFLPLSKYFLRIRFRSFLNKYLDMTETQIYELSSEQKEWINDKDLCPACGFKIKETDTICPDCGISIID